MQDFKKLQVWQKAHQVVLHIYKVTQTFPQAELYGLTSQLRRAAVSIPANIAEGCGRDTSAQLAHFLEIAMGSASELEYHILLTHDLDLLTTDDYLPLSQNITEIKRMLASFIRKLRTVN